MKVARMQKGGLVAVLAVGLMLMAFRPGPTDETLIQRITRQLEQFYTAARQEKAYLHLDRPVYATGETIWFSAYVVDASRHQLDSLSQVLHVDLLSPQRVVVARRTLRLQGGRASGDLDIADTLAAGTYVLRAYTNWMRNAGEDFIYSRRLSVWPASPLGPPDVVQPAKSITTTAKPKVPALLPGQADVQFFPEGGYLVEGLPAVVACKATDASGRSIEVHGQILNAQNAVVVPAFSSRRAGMGRFAFVPGSGQRYHAHLTLPNGGTDDYPLPAAQPNGYVLHVVETATDFLVEARYRGAAGAPAPGPVQLFTEVRGVVAYPGPRPIADAPAVWRMPKKNYPNGILHFTVFDEKGTPQCERLAFVQNGVPALKVTATFDQPSYGPHAAVQLNLQVTDAAGQPVAASLSVGVSDAGLSAIDPNAETIASNLLLTSDLVGYVENPGYYFRQQSAATALALDDLLLTQGWRRFVWKQVLAGQAPPVLFTPEQGIELGGQIVSEHGNRPIPNSQLTFLQVRPSKNVTTATTDGQGRFNFVGIPVQDTAIITLQARRSQGGSNVTIRPDMGPNTNGLPLPALPSLSGAPAGVAAFVRRSRQAQAADLDLHPEKGIRSIVLSNVAVTAKREAVPRDDPRRLYGATGGTVINFADIPSSQSAQNILQVLQGRVAGLTISGNPPNMTAQIRGSGSPLFILDGNRVDIDVISSLSALDVESIEVFKGNEAAIFGGSGGAIAIYTKRANPNYKGAEKGPAPGIATVKLPGFYEAREFYQPRYNALLTNPPLDPRTSTLYWNPTVRTNAKGQAELHFFTADGSGTFQAVVEGVSRDGQPAQGSGTMTARGK